MKEFPIALRQLRKQAGMSQPELAEKLGWDYDMGQGLVAYFGMYVF